MLNELIGACLGFLSGLGVGGGSLLLLWLTLAAGVEQSRARLINLMFFLPCALVATLLRRGTGKIPRRTVLTAVAAALLGAWLGVTLGRCVDVALLKKLFGELFLVTGLRELRWRPKN